MAGEARGEQAKEPKRTSWAQLLQAAGGRLIPLLISASALFGFVAFAGAVIVWTRFFAVKVPPDQVVTAVPRGELIATGSSLLLLFGFFGVLTVVATFLIDRGGRATPGMARGLLVVLALEGVTAIMINAGGLSLEAAISIGVFVAILLLNLAGTFFDRFTSISDTLPARDNERLDPKPRLVQPWIKGTVLDPHGARQSLRRVWRSIISERQSREDAEKEAQEREEARDREAQIELSAAEEEVARAGRALKAARRRASGPGWRGRVGALAGLIRADSLTSAERRAEHGLQRAEDQLRELQTAKARMDENRRRLRFRPNQLKFTGPGVLLGLLLMVPAIVLPAFVFLEDSWVAVPLGAATLLATGLWRIAALSKPGFLWFGLAAFISVPLFGTLTLMAQNLDDPQVQPVALIRSTDGPDEAIQGLYVTEGDDRVYFATVATEGCSGQIREGSGRLLWVPKSEVVAMSVGPLQSVDDAARASLEMAAALTPAVETLSGVVIDLHVDSAERESSEAAMQSERAPRLEDSGTAVRPIFGTGVKLEPESASAGELVTLSINTATTTSAEQGFGARRRGRTLRVGGAEAKIAKEATFRATGAEFVEADGGRVLPLDKRGLYRKVGKGEYELIDTIRNGGSAYVKLGPRSGALASFETKAIPKGTSARVSREIEKDGDGGVYLAVDSTVTQGAVRREHLRAGQAVQLSKDELPLGLEKDFLLQAWDEEEITFTVPEHASSGVVTVECEELAGQPLLNVARPLTARIAVRLQEGSDKVIFDAGGSSEDDGEIASRRWTIEGIPRGNGETVSERLTPRRTPYRVRLTVTDHEGRTDVTEVQVLRLLSSHLGLGLDEDGDGKEEKKRRATGIRRSLIRAARKDQASELQLDVHRDRELPGKDLSASVALGGEIRGLLLADDQSGFRAGGVPVRRYAFGDRCPPPRRKGARVWVDMFVFGDGVRVVPPRGCHAGRLHTTHW